MVRAYPEHLGAALRAVFILAGHTAPMRQPRLTLGADALSFGSHSVSMLSRGHHESLQGRGDAQAPA